MQYEYIAKPGFHKDINIFRRDTSVEICWHCVGIIDVLGTLRFSNLTDLEEQNNVHRFVVYNNLSKKTEPKNIFLPTLRVG